jgi:hypothetical protein
LVLVEQEQAGQTHRQGQILFLVMLLLLAVAALLLLLLQAVAVLVLVADMVAAHFWVRLVFLVKVMRAESQAVQQQEPTVAEVEEVLAL